VLEILELLDAAYRTLIREQADEDLARWGWWMTCVGAPVGLA
jgi:hypothetical protein